MPASVIYRGRETLVEYQNVGCDLDPSTHALDWWFIDRAMDADKLTDAEYHDIYDQLMDILSEPPPGLRVEQW